MVCHKLNQFNSQVFILYFSWNCCRLQEAKKFSTNHISHIHRGTLTECLELSCRISSKTYDHAETTLFLWGHQFCWISSGKNLFIYWLRRNNLGLVRQFQQIHEPESHRGTRTGWTCERCVNSTSFSALFLCTVCWYDVKGRCDDVL